LVFLLRALPDLQSGSRLLKERQSLLSDTKQPRGTDSANGGDGSKRRFLELSVLSGVSTWHPVCSGAEYPGTCLLS
jgi:hypothetical protein